MKKELDQLLCARYPLIFAAPPHVLSEPCTVLGFECGDGWFDLIDVLCERLQSLTDQDGAPQVVAAQVKEKWGGLCFYLHGGANDEQWGMITMAEAMSVRICDQCGAPGTLLASGRVHMTRCTLHAPAGAHPVETECHAEN
ncbi:hypothetical protein L1281_001822 [Neisseria sp. HSC-16F19]|nr:hypothetical protein [Neisseria sp. HSC-16F19]MCP2041228.1 hypothetical protein [Neisseria sp. HSC-16F19]